MIRSLISYPRSMSARAVIATIGHKAKQDVEDEAYRNYISRCLRLLTENTAVPAGYYSNGEAGSYVPMEYYDIVHPKPVKEYKKGAVAEKIKARLR